MKINSSIDLALSKLPTFEGLGAGAWLLTLERVELARLKAQKFHSVRAIDLLEGSIKKRANELIQDGVPA